MRDGFLLCDKCGSTIRVQTPEVLEVHKVMCDKWAAEKELV